MIFFYSDIFIKFVLNNSDNAWDESGFESGERKRMLAEAIKVTSNSIWKEGNRRRERRLQCPEFLKLDVNLTRWITKFFPFIS